MIENNKVKFFVENLKGYFGNMNEYVVVVWDEEGIILEYKENGEKLLGYSPNQIEGKKWLDVLIDDKEKEEMEWVYNKLISGEVFKYYVNPIRDVNGVKKTFLWYNSKIESAQNNKRIFLSIGFSLDAIERLNRKIHRYEKDLYKMSAESENLRFKISKQDLILKQKDEMIKDYKTKVEFLAFYDELTKLPNKNSLMRWLNLRISQADNMSTYLIFLEVRNLEKLNVMYGYDLVDELIIHISKRIEEILGKENKIFKIGSDRFAIIGKTDNVSEFIENLLKKLLVTYNINGNLIKVSYNVGATAIEDVNDSTANVIRKCDLALIRAKEKGLNKYEIFKPSLEVQTLKEGIIERELRNGLDLNEFVVFYQPTINLKNNQICGFEALLRWHYLKSVFVSPLEFIPVAEKCGLIVELGNIVLEQSLKVAKWLSRYITDEFIISINISPQQFSDREFIRSTIQILENEGLANVKLQFEITEKLAIENIDYAIEVINQLRKYNITFALDDFGVDYSSLNYLRRLPIQAVKIDKSFVQDIEKDETYFIVETIIKLCKKLGLKVVAEGVETEEHYRAVKELGCDYVQGYFISRPLGVEELIKFIEKYKCQNESNF
ncbi:GGDEF domain-containing protein [Caldicellulosiruptor bescii]|uniref:GGDEF domain-containing protein n=1 Tax=Caldicellulosiruptor bescii TaxID=31899 RepID=UPI00211808A9|nr:GGDEF domain-containing protein [Caldicellulosiruptor bescii]